KVPLMRYLTANLLAGYVLVHLVAFTAAQQPNNRGVTPDDLVGQLGNRKFAERNAAAAALEVLGAAALPALEQGLKSSDLETRRRVEQLREKILDRLEARRLLAGTRVRLAYRDKPVLEAVKDLAARTGFDIQIDGEATDLVGRTVTLDTEEMTFWE